MSWILALLYLVSGLIAGACGIVYLIAWRLWSDATARLEFLRIFATRWPDTVERALLDVQVMSGDGNEYGMIELEPIEFKLCRHCQLPWPTDENGALIRHPAVNVRPYVGGSGALSIACEGSETREYDDAST